NLFETLNSVDDVMDLRNLGIYQGDIQLNFGNNATLRLVNTNLDLQANDLTGAGHLKNVQRSVNVLSFDKGVFKRGDLTAYLNDVHLSENKSGLRANSMQVAGRSIKANANNIFIGAVILDSASQSIYIDGIKWSKANLSMTQTAQKTASSKATTKKIALVLKNVQGDHTALDLALGQTRVTGDFNRILLNQFIKNTAGKPEIRGLALDGQNVWVIAPDLQVTVGKLDIEDNEHSVLEQIEVQKLNRLDTIAAIVPRLTIIPNITEI